MTFTNPSRPGPGPGPRRTAGWLAAAALGGPVFMTAEHVARIATRPDEAHRRRILAM